MNAELKKQKSELSDMLNIVDNGFINTTGNMYLFDSQEEGDMYIYDASGVLIDKRRLRPDERQLAVFRKIGEK